MLAFFFARKPIGLGIALAVAWLSGSWFWIPILVCVLGLGLYLLGRSRADMQSLANSCPFRTKAFRNAALLSVLASLFLLASAFLLNPAGLSGIAGGLARLWASNQETT